MPTTSKITIPVGFSFDDLSGNLNKVASVLNNLKVDSTITKQVQSAIAAAEAQIKGLQKIQDRGISKQSDIDAMTRGLDAYEKQIARIQNILQGVKLKDLNLPPEVSSQMAQLNAQISQLQYNISHLKQENFKNLVLGSEELRGKMQAILGDKSQQISTQQQLNTALKDEASIVQSQIAEYEQKKQQLIDAKNSLKEFNDIAKQTTKDGKFLSGQGKPDSDARNQMMELAKKYNVLEQLQGVIKSSSFQEIKKAFADLFQWRTNDTLQRNIKNIETELDNLRDKTTAITELKDAVTRAVESGDPAQMQAALVRTRDELERVKTEAESTGRQTILQQLATDGERVGPSLTAARSAVQSLQNTLQTRTSAENIMTSITNGVTRLIGIRSVMNQVRQGISTAVNQIKELDAAMNGIAVVTNYTTSELWGQIDTYMAMAKQYGVTTTGTYQVSQLYYQMGLSTNQVMSLTTETLKMAKIAGLDYAEATDYMAVA